jgi:hypothetical protein
MNDTLIAAGILFLAILALAVRNEHRLTSIEKDLKAEWGVDNYLEGRLDKQEARLDKLEE